MSDGISFLPLGAILQSFNVDGTNIVQGFTTQEQYEKYNAPHFGETIGRVANRISDARIHSLNGGQSYPLAANNGPNCLHGGLSGWAQKIWEGPTPVGVRTDVPGLGKLDSGGESVRFELTSPDGDEGFPGAVKASVVYTAGKQTVGGNQEATVLVMDYEAELVGGAEETVVNMTNHSYFNLEGTTSIEGTVVELATNTYLPLNEFGIPTAGPAVSDKVPPGGTPFTLGAAEPVLDDCFVTNEKFGSVPIDTRSEPLVRLAAAHHPASRVHLEVYSTEPAFQFYTGKWINVPAVDGLPARGARSGFCVEPSRYVNAINEDAWKSQVVLKKGEKYGARIVYRAWKQTA